MHLQITKKKQSGLPLTTGPTMLLSTSPNDGARETAYLF